MDEQMTNGTTETKDEEQNKYVLAMYDIRGKQDYIYKSTKMKEIVGASLIIRDCFTDYLFPAAEEYCREKELTQKKGIYSYQVEPDESGKYVKRVKEKDSKEESSDTKDKETDFQRKKFINRMNAEDGYIGEVVYDGGGNFLVLYKDIEAYRGVNRIFYKKILEETYSLRILTSYIEGVDFNNFKNNHSALRNRHRINEQQECVMHPVNVLPFVQTDYKSSMPLSEKVKMRWEQDAKKYSRESAAKYKKYAEILEKIEEKDKPSGGPDSKEEFSDRDIEGARVLDHLITEKGEDSHLAVIYIDGNSMGAKVEECTKDKTTYEESIKALREFSEDIQTNYIDKPIERINKFLDEESEKEAKKNNLPANAPGKNKRFVVYAGDEITFVCNAKYAYKVVQEYFKGDKENVVPCSCAGIAIFHSHTPFADAYRIAEECCETGKSYMKDKQLTDASLMDFHYCQGAIGTSLENIRKQEEMTDISRPWFVMGAPEDEYRTTDVIDELVKEILKINRSNMKTLMHAAREGDAAFQKEMSRILAHWRGSGKKPDISLNGVLNKEQQRRLVFDIMQIYDLWFAEKGDDKADADDKTGSAEGDK